MKVLKIMLGILSFNLVAGIALAKEDHHHHQEKAATPAAESVKPLKDESIYNLKSELLTVDGKKISLESLKGQPVVISMAYTSCAYACPLIISHMQQLEKELDKKGVRNVHFVLVSFDPKKDTPPVIKKYVEKRKLSKNWDFYTAESDKSPREIATLLGIKYKKIDEMDYDHSFIITVLDSEGVIKGQQSGADKDPKELAKFIKN
ncbi:MAG: SCO family protein [Bdellovibrio sp.]|nr:SCO family protein [Bdellovibrio sp.]